jgi:hypothetical protein
MRHSYYSSIRVLCVLALGLVFGACRHDSTTQPPTDDCCHGVINFTAQDSATGHGVQGAAVTLSGTTSAGTAVTRGPETTTDGGHTTFREMCPGTYVIHTSKDGYHTSESHVTLTCDDTVSLTTTLASATSTNTECHSGQITLIVHDSATGQVLTGGSATLYHNGQAVSTLTIGTGAVWYHLGTGHYSFSLTKDGYHSPVHFDIDSLTCDEHRTVEWHMSPVHSTPHDSCCNNVMELALTDGSTHHALAGATVIISRDGMTSITETTTDGGNVRFADLCTGHYHVVISKDGYHSADTSFGEECGTGRSISMSLWPNTTTTGCDSSSMTIRLADSTHQDTYLSGATVTIRIDGHSDNIASGTTTDGGYFYSHNNLPGHTTYILTFSKDGYNTKTVVWQLTDCHNYHETWVLSHH